MQSIIPKGIRPAYPDAIPTAAVRSKLVELLGLEEIPVAIDYITESWQEEDGLCTMRVRYENSLGETVPGILMVPREESAQMARYCLRTRHGGEGRRDCPPALLPRTEADGLGS